MRGARGLVRCGFIGDGALLHRLPHCPQPEYRLPCGEFLLRNGAMSAELKFDSSTHFQFGDNWAEYSRSIGDADIAISEAALSRLVGLGSLAGKSFLDIGCGSGIHSLAALRLGAKKVKAIDIDETSVACTRRVIESRWHKKNFDLELGNVFEIDTEDEGRFDIVYSWGVLHHTGDMWGAIEAASKLVRPGGLFVIAVYLKTRCCGFWKIEKKFFTGAGPLTRKAFVYAYIVLRMIADMVRLKNPLRWFRRRDANKRGMKWYTDVVDWLGGYPYESATPGEIRAFVEGLGFKQVSAFRTRSGLGVFGTGNAEYRFQSLEADTPG